MNDKLPKWVFGATVSALVYFTATAYSQQVSTNNWLDATSAQIARKVKTESEYDTNSLVYFPISDEESRAANAKIIEKGKKPVYDDLVFEMYDRTEQFGKDVSGRLNDHLEEFGIRTRYEGQSLTFDFYKIREKCDNSLRTFNEVTHSHFRTKFGAEASVSEGASINFDLISKF